MRNSLVLQSVSLPDYTASCVSKRKCSAGHKQQQCQTVLLKVIVRLWTQPQFSNSNLFFFFLSGISLICHEIEKLFHLFLIGLFLFFLVVESNCEDTAIQTESHLMNETILLSKEDEGFVLAPVDYTGQNLTVFLLTDCFFALLGLFFFLLL